MIMINNLSYNLAYHVSHMELSTCVHPQGLKNIINKVKDIVHFLYYKQTNKQNFNSLNIRGVGSWGYLMC